MDDDYFDRQDEDRREASGPDDAAALTLAQIEELASRGGQFAALWAELGEARRDREAAAEAKRVDHDVEDALKNGTADFEDQEFLADLRAHVEIAREKSWTDMLTIRREEFEKAGWPDDEVNRFMEDEQALVRQAAWFFESPNPLYESEAYRDYKRGEAEAARAKAAAADARSKFRSIDQDAADAHAGILATVDAALDGES
jgi:hypothetical protein